MPCSASCIPSTSAFLDSLQYVLGYVPLYVLRRWAKKASHGVRGRDSKSWQLRVCAKRPGTRHVTSHHEPGPKGHSMSWRLKSIE